MLISEENQCSKPGLLLTVHQSFHY
jgi:hypothetical protein